MGRIAHGVLFSSLLFAMGGGCAERVVAELLPPPAVTSGVDPYLAQAWHLQGAGAVEAWKITEGDPRTTIAIVDSGLDFNHPEFSANLLRNLAEYPPNGIDDDGNGYIDDVIGWDFVRETWAPKDESGHGTFLAGFMAAVKGNSIGSAGICPKCSILPLKFINEDGLGDTEDAIEAIRYAAKKKVAVINVSFSGEGYDKPLHDALKLAGANDCVVVAAASNDGLDLDKNSIYPAKFGLPHMITVAASGKTGTLWKDSNWGKRTVHFSAPGVDVLSLWLGNWETGSGTSDAAAVVSGVVGLLRSAVPTLKAPEVVKVLMATSKQTAGQVGKTITGGTVDAGAAIACALDATLPCLKGFNYVIGGGNSRRKQR